MIDSFCLAHVHSTISIAPGRTPGSDGVAVRVWHFREYVLRRLGAHRSRLCSGTLLHHGRLRKGPFEGPATVKPPALPEAIYYLYFYKRNKIIKRNKTKKRYKK